MANTDIVSCYPVENVGANGGIRITTGDGNWGYSGWQTLYKVIPADINVYSVCFQISSVATVDTVMEFLIEIGTGNAQSPTLKIQIPYSQKTDTAVGIYLTDRQVYLPEPVKIVEGSNIYVRGSCGNTGRILQNIRIMFTSTKKFSAAQSYPNNYQRFVGGGGPMGVV